jgi:HSP20 family protein
MLVRVNFDQPINELIQQFLTEEYVPAGPAQPVMDVAEYENESVILVELPGVKKEDIAISVENGWLTLKGERKLNPAAEIKRVLHCEIEPHAFARTIKLPHVVDVNAISAELENGLLRITLPKADEVRPRTIAVK